MSNSPLQPAQALALISPAAVTPQGLGVGWGYIFNLPEATARDNGQQSLTRWEAQPAGHRGRPWAAGRVQLRARRSRAVLWSFLSLSVTCRSIFPKQLRAVTLQGSVLRVTCAGALLGTYTMPSFCPRDAAQLKVTTIPTY